MRARSEASRRPRAGRDADAGEVAQALLRPGARPVVTSHHNPDGDAIGSMLGLARALRSAGQEVEMAHPDRDPVPPDLAFLLAEGEEILERLPDDIGERLLVAVDCASGKRLWQGPDHEAAGELLNVDHHQDNTRFGDLNLVEPQASSTAEVLLAVLEAAGIPLGPEIATPLYVGLVTDTGRFGYSNTTPATHRAAAALIEAGADPAELARRLFEEQPVERLLLTGRALERARPLVGGRVLASVLIQEDFDWAGTDDSEGIVEVMRGALGVEASALVRQAGPGYRVSLRAEDPEVDVSAIAREAGGGGHRAAAGFSTDRPPEELLAWLEERFRERLDAGRAA